MNADEITPSRRREVARTAEALIWATGVALVGLFIIARWWGLL